MMAMRITTMMTMRSSDRGPLIAVLMMTMRSPDRSLIAVLGHGHGDDSDNYVATMMLDTRLASSGA